MEQKNEISSRFIQAYNRLIEIGEVNDKRDFANKIGISASMVTEISKGRSNVGVTAIQNIVSVFDISSEWILTGKGEMIRNSKSDQLVTPMGNPTLEDKLLKIISQQAEKIGRLEAEMDHLKKGIENGQQDVQDAKVADVG